MHNKDLISRAEYALAMEQIVRLRIPRRGSRPTAAMHSVLRLDQRLRNLQTRKRLTGVPRNESDENTLIVKTTLDLELQQELTWMAESAVRWWENKGAGNASLILVDRSTNEVRAWVGSTYYFDPLRAGAIDYTNIARSSGSTLKPFLYALALERGVITPATILADLPRGATGIINSDQQYLGPLLPRTALANSRNVPAVNLLQKVGLDEQFALMEDLGLHDGSQAARHFGLGLAIGALPVTLEQLVRAYSVLAGDGRLRDLVWYSGQTAGAPRRILSENTVRQVSLFISDPMARLPTFPRMGWNEYPFPVAVKTGTSTGYRDAWTVSYSSRYLLGVWIGHPGCRPMRGVSGYRAASRLAHQVLTYLHRDQGDGLEDLKFPPPRDMQAMRLCALTGKRATSLCDRVSLEWLAPGQEPVNFCDAHLRIAVDKRNGLVATSSTPAGFTELRTFVQLPPLFAAWAAGAGLPHPPLGASVFNSQTTADSSRAMLSRNRTVNIQITSPEIGLRLLRDPETPPGMATLALRAMVSPPSEQILWYVDGAPFQLVDYPYTARWPLEPGEHTFQAQLPSTDLTSGRVRVLVQ